MEKGISSSEQKIIKNILQDYDKEYSFFYYGSRVKGNYEKTSDLDILIQGDKEMPLSVLRELQEKFDSSSLPYIVNFSDYQSINKNFYQIIKKDLIPYDLMVI